MLKCIHNDCIAALAQAMVISTIKLLFQLWVASLVVQFILSHIAEIYYRVSVAN